MLSTLLGMEGGKRAQGKKLINPLPGDRWRPQAPPAPACSSTLLHTVLLELLEKVALRMIAGAQGTGSTGAEGQEVSGQLFFLFAFQTLVICLYTSPPQQQYFAVSWWC